MNIRNKISLWQNAGLISEQQGSNIMAYEAGRTKPYIFYGLLALAVFCIGLGIISIIAANWAKIMPEVKLGMNFVLLSACAYGIWRAYVCQKNNWFEVGMFFFALMVLGSIGLIAQIYQLQSDGCSAFLLWSVLIFPLLFFIRRSLLPTIWVPVFWFSFWRCIIEWEITKQLLDLITDSWIYAIPLFWLFSWCLIWQILDIYFKKYALGLQKALKFWLIVFMGILIYIIDVHHQFSIFYEFAGNSKLSFAPVFTVSVALILGIMALTAYVCLSNRKFFLPYVMALMFLGSLYSVPYVLSLAVLLGMAFYACRQKNQKMFNLALLLIGWRVFDIYLEVFGGLMATGMGLIISGIVLLLIIGSWTKASAYLKRKLEHEK